MTHSLPRDPHSTLATSPSASSPLDTSSDAPPSSSPLPSPPPATTARVALQEDDAMNGSASATPPVRPQTSRSVTEPTPSILLQEYFRERRERDGDGGDVGVRTRSSLVRSSHLRSRSSGGNLPVVMTRAHSMPAVHTARFFDIGSPALSPSGSSSAGSGSPIRGGSGSSSPMRAPPRVRSPFRPQVVVEGVSATPSAAPRSPVWFEGMGTGVAIEAIQEDSELDLTRRTLQTTPTFHAAAIPRSNSLRRRPASPLHSVAIATTTQQPQQQPWSFDAPPTSATLLSATDSPSLGPQKYNESYPPLHLHHHASNTSLSSSQPGTSVPSTPTSARSRSPSISSLDTIEDVPDLESAALETERMEQEEKKQRLAEGNGAGEEDATGVRRRSSLDMSRGAFARSMVATSGVRKRWSICGGERRADLDLETIWED